MHKIDRLLPCFVGVWFMFSPPEAKAGCSGNPIAGVVANGIGGSLIGDSIEASRSKGGFSEFSQAGISDPPRYYLTKELSSNLTICYYSEANCEGSPLSSDRYVDQGSCWYEIDVDGFLDYHEDGFYDHYYNDDGCGGGELLDTFEDWCGIPEGGWESLWSETFTKTVMTVTADDCSTSGSGTETLTDEYTTDRLIGVTVGQLPLFAPESEWGSYVLSSRNLSLNEFSYSLRRSKYKWSFTPDPSGLTKLYWVERFTPDEPGREPEDSVRSFVYEGTDPGPLETPVYNLFEPGENGTRSIENIGYTATFELCPGKYEIILTFINSADETREENLGVFDIEESPFVIGGANEPGEQLYAAKAIPLPKAEFGAQCGVGSSSARWGVSMGKYDHGSSAGAIRLYEQELSPGSFSPSALIYTPINHPDIDVIYDTNDALRQVRVPQGLADVVSYFDANEGFEYYEIRFYHDEAVTGKVGGLYTVSSPSTAFSVWRVEDPDSGAMDRIRIGQMEGNLDTVFIFSYDALEDAWALNSGTGLSVVEQKNRIESVTWNGNQVDQRVATITVSDLHTGPERITSVREERFHSFDWGEERIEEVLDPSGSDPWTTTWIYYHDLGSDGINYSRLKERIDPTGYWERYEYDALGRVIKTISSWKGSGLSNVGTEGLHRVRTTEFWDEDLNGDGQPDVVRRDLERIEDQEVSRTYRIEWGTYTVDEDRQYLQRTSRIRTVGPGDDWDTPGMLETVSYRYVSGPWRRELKKEIHPDATVTLYHYSVDSGIKTITAQRGVFGEVEPEENSIIAGRSVTSHLDIAGNVISRIERDIASDVVLDDMVATDFDSFGRPTKLEYELDDTFELKNYSCCGGLSYHRSREGVETHYHHDALRRLYRVEHPFETPGGPASIEYEYDLDGEGRRIKTTRVGTDTSLIVIDEKTYDLAGRLASSQGAVVDPTVFSEEPGSANGLWERKTVYPGGAERIEVSYLDGTIKEIKGDTETTGNPVTLRKFDYGVTTAGERWTREIRVGVGGAVTEWTERYQNMLGQQIRTEYPDGTIESRTFNEKGQLVRVYRGPSPETTGSEVQITLFAYNDLGEQEYTVVDVAQSIDPETWDVENEKGGTARITKTTNEVVTDPDRLRSTTTIWTKDTDANETETVQISERSVSSLESWQTAFGVTTHTITTLDGDGGKTVRTNRADDSYRIEISQDGRLQSSKEYDANDQQLEGVTYQYDEHGRVSEVIDERNGATEYTYFDDDQVETVTTPDPDSSRFEAGWLPQVTTFEYDERGRQKTVIHPDNTETFTTYWPSGQVRRVSGSRSYPVEYTYDRQGRMLTMTTWQDYDVPGNEEGAVDAATTWSYDPNRGWLTEKKDSDLKKTIYTYDALGRLKTRTWDRGPVTTYGYTTTGELTSITYTGETIDAALHAADVDIQYDRRGLRESVTETRGSTVVSERTFTYSDHWQLEEEEWTDGVLDGFTLQREYLDSLKRLTEIRLKQGSSTILFQEIDYAPGRPHIASVSDLTVPSVPVRADFTIEPDSRMIANTKFYHDQTLRFEVTRQRDALDRLGSISSSTASFTYDYNAANQRNKVITEDDQYWNWGYDDLGQLESATRHQSSGQKVLGHDFTFTHDTIGNRTQAVRNGTPSTYQPNLLNQYEERDVPGIVHILGMANPEATVTVEQQPTLRQDALFYNEFPVDNDPASVHETLQIRGVKIEDGAPPENHVSDVERQVFVPGTPESFAYDDDGNLLHDGRWNYVWNAENRLVRMETRTGLAATLVRQRLDFTYDSDGRRIRKSVLEWDNVSSNFVPVSSTRYLYNNWNLLAEIDETDSLIRSYLWGPSENGQYDTTATPGALLGLRDHTDNNAFYFAQADGNGNIAILIAATDGSQAARYEYGPFGEPLRATGPMAQANPHRFSSKLVDTETGLYYYGYRYYSPGIGRFLNRDPIGERGGLNLYGFVGNDPVNYWDVLGLQRRPAPPPRPHPTIPGRPNPPPMQPPSPGRIPGLIGDTIEAILDAIDGHRYRNEHSAAAIMAAIARAAPKLCDEAYRNHSNPAPKGCGCCVYIITVTRMYPATEGSWLMPPQPPSGPAVAIHGFSLNYIPTKCDKTDRGGDPGQVLNPGESEIIRKITK